MTRRLRVAILLSGLGHVVHNVEEFGRSLLMVGQTLTPAAVTALLVWAARRPTRRYLALLGAWGLLVVVAGGGSVLPLPFLPFVPAQTVSHYAVHLLYAALQLPMLVVASRGLWGAEEEVVTPTG